jgi:D-3-phosphoglycerate dehydrogenase
MHDGVWQKSASGSREIRGKNLGIIGYGNIGAQLSVLAESLGLNVFFYVVLRLCSQPTNSMTIVIS